MEGTIFRIIFKIVKEINTYKVQSKTKQKWRCAFYINMLSQQCSLSTDRATTSVKRKNG